MVIEEYVAGDISLDKSALNYLVACIVRSFDLLVEVLINWIID